MKTYRGIVTPQGDYGAVFVVDKDYATEAEFRATLRALHPRYDLRNHSPTGFAWGYWGSGPAQLSLAILADCLGDDERALELYQEFKCAVVGKLAQDKAWTLTEEFVRIKVAELEARRVS